MGFGVDSRKLYFQFSFVEYSQDSSKQILEQRHFGQSVPFMHLEEVVESLLTDCWEPAAEAAILSLCIRKFGRDTVLGQLSVDPERLNTRNMIEEWDYPPIGV